MVIDDNVDVAVGEDDDNYDDYNNDCNIDDK